MTHRELAASLSTGRDRIVGQWAKRTKAVSKRYSEVPLEELRANLGVLFDGIVEYVDSGDRTALNAQISRVSRLRAQQGFELSDTLAVLSAGMRVVFDVLKEECDSPADPVHCFDIVDKMAEVFCEISIRHAKILEDTRNKFSTAETVSTIAEAHQRLDEKVIAQHSVESLRSRFGIRAAALVLTETDEPFFAEAERGDEVDAFRFACEEAVARREMVKLEPKDSTHGPGALRPLIGVPITAGGEVIGALAIASGDSEPLTDADIEVATSLASQMGVACEIARQYRGAMDTVGRLGSDRSELFAILSALEAVVYVADMNTYEIIAANKGLEDSYGSDLVGRKCYEVLQENQDGPCPFCTNDRLMIDGVPAKPYAWKFRNTKTGRWYNCVDKAIPWPDGRTVRLELAFDITELENARLRSERNGSHLRLYNDLLLHDLGNYAATMSGFLELLDDSEELADDLKPLVASADSQVRKCSHLIQRVKQFSKVQSADDVTRETVDLEVLLDSAIDAARELLPEAKADISRSYGEGPHRVRVGAFANEIFVNLVSNALKYGEGRDVDVSIDGGSIEGRPAWRATVADHGPGIPPDMRKAIFERYTRLVSSKKLKGTGLGLSIAKTLVDRYGGEMKMEDRVPGNPSEGASFSVLLPKA